MYPQVYYRPTSSMAIVSLVMIFVCAPLAIVFGVVAKNQIKQAGEQGEGMATGGLIAGSVVTGLAVLAMIFLMIAAATAARTISQIH